MSQYLWLVFLLILAFLLIRNAEQAKRIINSLSSANVGAIMALQGRNPGGYTN